QHDRFQRVREFVDVQNFHAVKLGDFVQIEIVGNDLAIVDLRQLDQLHIHFANVGKIVFQDLNVQLGHLLDALQDIQAAAAAVALHRVRRIGDQLQLPQDKLRDHQRAVDKSGFYDIGDPSIDNDAGVEDLE